MSESGRELGEFTVSINRVKKNHQDCFLVHANSHGTIDGVPCGTSVTAYISKTLDTIEQQHQEFVKVRQLLTEVNLLNVALLSLVSCTTYCMS